MPQNFPGIVPFLDDSSLRPGWGAKISTLWFVGRAIDAAASLPHQPTEQGRAECLAQIDAAEAGLFAALETVQRMRKWSVENLQMNTQTKSQESSSPRRTMAK